MRRAMLSLWFLPYFSKFSATCAASSRVGSRISVRGMRARARPFSRSVSIGSTKEASCPCRSVQCRGCRGAAAPAGSRPPGSAWGWNNPRR